MSVVGQELFSSSHIENGCDTIKVHPFPLHPSIIGSFIQRIAVANQAIGAKEYTVSVPFHLSGKKLTLICTLTE